MADLTAKARNDRMAETELPATVIDEATVRALFARFNDREAFFADPEGTWIDRPHYRVFAQNLEMHTREEVVAWFRGFFDAVPDLHMEVEDVVVASEPGHERVTVRWHITGTFSGAPHMGIEPTGGPVDLRGMDLIRTERGRVAGNNIYYDQLTFARQVGILPAEGSLADRVMTRAFKRRHAGAGRVPTEPRAARTEEEAGMATRLTGAMMVAVAAMLLLAASAAATPGSLEFGKCEKVAEGTGAFRNGLCTKPHTGGSYAWSPLSEPVKITISKAPKTARPEFEAAGGIEFPCTSAASISGALMASGPTGVVLDVSGCTTLGVACNSEGQRAEVIHTDVLGGAVGVIQKNAEGKEAADIVGVALEGAGGAFAQVECGSVAIAIRGGVIAQFPANKNASVFKVSYMREKSKQVPESFAEGPADFLEWSFDSKPYERLGFSFASVWKTALKTKIELRHCEANVC